MNILISKAERFFKTDIHYLATSGLWLTAAKGLGLITAFVSSVIFANILPEETYGTFRFVLSAFALLSIPSLKGIDTAIVTAVAKGYDYSYIHGLRTKLRFGVLTGVACLATSLYYALHGNDTLAIIFLSATILLPLMEASYLYISLLNGKKEFKEVSVSITFSRILTTTTLILTVFATQEIAIIVFVYLLANIVPRIFFGVRAKKKYVQNQKNDPTAITYGKHLTLIQSITVLSIHLDKILLFHFLGGAVLAGYYLALMPFRQIKNIFSALNMLALPKMANNSLSQLRSTLPMKLLQLYILILPTIALYLFLAPYIFTMFFPLYTEYVLVSQVFIFTLLLYPASLFQTALTAQKKNRELYTLTVVTSLFRIIALCAIVPFWGFWGAIFVLIASQLLYNIQLCLFFFWSKDY